MLFFLPSPLPPGFMVSRSGLSPLSFSPVRRILAGLVEGIAGGRLPSVSLPFFFFPGEILSYRASLPFFFFCQSIHVSEDCTVISGRAFPSPFFLPKTRRAPHFSLSSTFSQAKLRREHRGPKNEFFFSFFSFFAHA